MTDLRKAAEAATPGPWAFSPMHLEEGPPAVRSGNIYGWSVAITASDADAAYIAAANPQAILALLDERDALTARVEELEKALKPFADAWGKMPTEAHPNEHCRFYNYTVCTLGDLRRAAAAMEGKK